MKIRDTKIAEKLPELHKFGYSGEARAVRDKVLNTDLNLEDIVEVDVDKVFTAMYKCEFAGNLNPNERKQLAKAIAKAGILKWRETNG